MRILPSEMTDRWLAGGPFVGAGRIVYRFTVEPDWYLRSYLPGEEAVINDLGPFGDADATEGYRSFQTAAQDQLEVEIPNAVSFTHDHSIDQDAATFTLVLANTVAIGDEEIGDRGHFSPYRSTPEGDARWDDPERVRNRPRSEWNRILTENCLIRSYWGYGPDAASMPIAEALEEGKLVRDGTWLADTVTPNPITGILTIQGRDMAKLLVEQRNFPPFAPPGLHPLRYNRWNVTTTPHGPELSLTNPQVSYPDRLARPGPGNGVIEWRMAYDITVHPAGTGYWVLENWGRVAFMSVPWFGDPELANGQSGVYTYRSIDATPTGEGYWVADRAGHVFAFGDAVDYGSAATPGVSNVIRLRRTSTGHGYWMLYENGRVEGFGDAVVHGDVRPLAPGAYVTDLVPGVHDEGYYIRGRGLVSAGFDEFRSFGSVAPVTASRGLGPTQRETAAWGLPRRRCDAEDVLDGIYVVGGFDPVYATDPDTEYIAGDIFLYDVGGSNPTLTPDMTTPELDYPPLVQKHLQRVDRLQAAGGGGYDPSFFAGSRTGYMQRHALPYFCAGDSTPDGRGIAVLARDGSVYCFGTLSDTSDYILGWTEYYRSEGIADGVKTYQDWADILADFLRWSGFTLYPDATLHGTIVTTGAYALDELGADVFDKKAPMEIINMIREVTGYLFFIDHDGAANFFEHNWVDPGNRLEDGSHTDTIWALDENLNLLDWTPAYTDQSMRSEIIVGSSEQDDSSGVTARVIPSGVEVLRGMVKPAAWWNGNFTSCTEARVLAEQIALYSYFADRQGAATTHYFPGVQQNDQLWVYEAVSGEYAIHYVRGIQVNWSSESGQATMSLTTHRLGTPTRWGVR